MKRKQQIRKTFRDQTFRRDKYCCVMCGLKTTPESADHLLDAHHITPREEMPNGGYVPENGISLCDSDNGCHYKAEMVIKGESKDPEFFAENLYIKIDSTKAQATQKARKLQ